MRVSFTDVDVELAANNAILAMDGRLGRDDAKRIARAVLKGFDLIYMPVKSVGRR